MIDARADSRATFLETRRDAIFVPKKKENNTVTPGGDTRMDRTAKCLVDWIPYPYHKLQIDA